MKDPSEDQGLKTFSKFRDRMLDLWQRQDKWPEFKNREKVQGAKRETYHPVSFSGNENNRFFHNQGGRFVEIGAGVGLGHVEDGRGVSAFDMDGDGDLDVLIRNFDRNPVQVLLNTVGQDRPWLRVQLEGQDIGAKIRVGKQIREITCGSGFLSQQPPEAHFGLTGDGEVKVEIRWPGKTEWMTIGPVSPRKIVVVKPDGTFEQRDPRPSWKSAPARPQRVTAAGDKLVDLKLRGKSAVSVKDLRDRFALVFFSINCSTCQAEMKDEAKIDGQVLWVSIGVDPELVEQTMGMWQVPIDPVYTTYDELKRLFGNERPLLPSIFIINDGVVEAKLVGSGAFKEAARRMKR